MACRHHFLLNIDAVHKQFSNGAAIAIGVDPSDDDRLTSHHPIEEVAGCIGIRVVVREGLHRRRTESRVRLPLRGINAGEPDSFTGCRAASITDLAAADGDLDSRCRCRAEPEDQDNTKRARDRHQPGSRIQCDWLLVKIARSSQAESMQHRVSLSIAVAAVCFSGNAALAHGKGLYATAAEAQARAQQIGCTTIHQNNGRWMPCTDEQELHRQLRKQ